MCAVSMTMNHYQNKWRKAPYYPPPPRVPGVPFVSPVTKEEVQEFRTLLRRAREYDKRHQQPDCELDTKRMEIKRLAESLCVDVSFVDAPKKRSKRTKKEKAVLPVDSPPVENR